MARSPGSTCASFYRLENPPLPEDPYFRIHARRYETLLAKVKELAPERPRILDVGQAYEAERLRALPGAVVDTLGFGDQRFPPREGERHIPFDLKAADQLETWPEPDGYDVVVCAEVIEHLPVSPLPALRFLGSALRPGGWLVLQTPNAARAANRLRLLAGRNPFEELRDDLVSPGHIREYTVDEVVELGRAAGLEPGGWLTANYFETGSRGNAIARRLGPLVPRRLRAGITAWLQRPG
jgi:SAM-dependent methyltransferase